MSSIKTSMSMNKQSAPVKIMQRRNNRGFTLLEALLGFLILSIGMLGIASLQSISLKAGKTTVYGTVAMLKVEELFESMRANPTAAALAVYATAGGGAGIDNSCNGTTICTDVQLAQDDIFWWKKNLAEGVAGLPAGATTTVTYTPATAPSKMATVQIDVNWDERDKDNGGGVTKTYSTTADICTGTPPC